jgi:hypothetical protein
MAEVTGRIGENDVELDNAATESTLRLLLLATAGSTKEMKRIIQMAEKAGLNKQVVDQANEDVENLGLTAGKGSRSIGALSKGAMILGGIVGDLAASAVKTAGNLVNLAGEFLNGTATVSSAFAAFKDLPLGLGKVASVFEKIVLFQQEGLEGYRQLTNSGINLAGGLTELRMQAAEVGMSFQEYGEMIGRNSEAIARMGISMDEANRIFRNVNRTITTGVNSELLNMGLNFRQINDLTASYIQVNAGLTDSQRRNNKLVTDSVVEYGKQLDALARLTGKQREEIAKELEQATQDAMWQEYLNGLDEDARANANAALMNAGVQGGKAAQDAIKAMFMGLPPLTDASRIYTATMRQGTVALQDQVRIAQNGRPLAENQLALDRQMARAIRGNIDDLEQFRTIMQAGGMTGDALAGAMIDVQKAVQIYRQKGLNTEEAMLQAIQEARRKQGKLTDQQIRDAIEAEKKFKNLTVGIMAALLPAIEKLSKPVTELAVKFAKLITDNIDSLSSALLKLADYVENLFTEEGRQQIINDLRKFLSDLFSDIWDIIKPWGESKEERDERYRVQNSSEYKAWLESVANSNNKVLQDAIKVGNQKDIYDRYIAQRTLDPANRPLVKMAEERASRATGSLGSTGNLFENFGNSSLIEAHGYEAVMTPAQLGDLLKSERTETAKAIAPTIASPNTDDDRLVKSSIEQGKTLVAELQTLNKQTADMMRYIRDTSEYTRKNLDAIRGLNGNLFAA